MEVSNAKAAIALRTPAELAATASVVETGQMSAVEPGQMSAVETGQMSAAETGQMFFLQEQTSFPS